MTVLIQLYGSTNGTHGEKITWEQNKNVMCCFEQVLEATTHETGIMQRLTYHLKNHPSKTVHCWRSKDERISNVL